MTNFLQNNKALIFLKSEKNAGKRIAIEVFLLALVFYLLSNLLSQRNIADFMIFCILVLSYDLLYGYMGYLSIGHMLYFGTGTYVSVIFMRNFIPNPLLAILAGTLAGALLALVIGNMVMRTKGATFALVNMAFNYMGFFLVAYAWTSITGGENGLASNVGSLGSFNLHQNPYWFYFVLLCLLLTFFLLRQLMSSPFGVMVRSIKQNETRLKFIGFNTKYYKVMTFVISSGLAAFAGTLNAINYGFIAPDYISPLRNAEIIFANLIGGAGNIYGALIGGIFYMVMRDNISIYFERWELILGIILVVMAIHFKTGISGYIYKVYLKWNARRTQRL
jgi:branched-chain amino acid transport system permease protein